jgi:oligopeptide/dipeptide ABC transporter ATP-binding protein
MDDLLTASNIRRTFGPRRRLFGLGEQGRAAVVLDGVSLSVGRREVVGLVGESGSGKTTLARTLVRLIEPEQGTIRFDGEDVAAADRQALRRLRRRMQLIYQDPYSSLNPRLRVGSAVGEPARVHGFVRTAAEERDMVDDLLLAVGLSPLDRNKRPAEMSGGQRQRVAIARALSGRPEMLIADEAVSALDVSVQAQILNLFDTLTRERHLSMIFISHQLAVIAQLSQRVAIMYLGRIVEIGTTADVFSAPQHPYTALLLAAHPSIEAPVRRRSSAMPGDLPSPTNIPTGCRFRARCHLAQSICAEIDPPPVDLGNGHTSWCHILPKAPAPSQAQERSIAT